MITNKNEGRELIHLDGNCIGVVVKVYQCINVTLVNVDNRVVVISSILLGNGKCNTELTHCIGILINIGNRACYTILGFGHCDFVILYNILIACSILNGDAKLIFFSLNAIGILLPCICCLNAKLEGNVITVCNFAGRNNKTALINNNAFGSSYVAGRKPLNVLGKKLYISVRKLLFLVFGKTVVGVLFLRNSLSVLFGLFLAVKFGNIVEERVFYSFNFVNLFNLNVGFSNNLAVYNRYGCITHTTGFCYGSNRVNAVGNVNKAIFTILLCGHLCNFVAKAIGKGNRAILCFTICSYLAADGSATAFLFAKNDIYLILTGGGGRSTSVAGKIVHSVIAIVLVGTKLTKCCNNVVFANGKLAKRISTLGVGFGGSDNNTILVKLNVNPNFGSSASVTVLYQRITPNGHGVGLDFDGNISYILAEYNNLARAGAIGGFCLKDIFSVCKTAKAEVAVLADEDIDNLTVLIVYGNGCRIFAYGTAYGIAALEHEVGAANHVNAEYVQTLNSDIGGVNRAVGIGCLNNVLSNLGIGKAVVAVGIGFYSFLQSTVLIKDFNGNIALCVAVGILYATTNRCTVCNVRVLVVLYNKVEGVVIRRKLMRIRILVNNKNCGNVESRIRNRCYTLGDQDSLQTCALREGFTRYISNRLGEIYGCKFGTVIECII